MANSLSSEERRQVEQWLDKSRRHRQLILEQVALISGLQRCQKRYFIALQKNAAALAKLAPK
jgi:hypothetical protein